MVDKALKLSIETKDCQRESAGAPFGTSSMCELPRGPSVKFDWRTQEAV